MANIEQPPSQLTTLKKLVLRYYYYFSLLLKMNLNLVRQDIKKLFLSLRIRKVSVAAKIPLSFAIFDKFWLKKSPPLHRRRYKSLVYNIFGLIFFTLPLLTICVFARSFKSEG
jgi:hypothetical protein